MASVRSSFRSSVDLVASQPHEGVHRQGLPQRMLADNLPVGQFHLPLAEIRDCLLFQPSRQVLGGCLVLGLGFLGSFLKRFEPPLTSARDHHI